VDTYSLLALGTFILSPLILFIFFQLLRRLIRKQIDDQLKNMIPIKAIREKVGIRINWRK
tara:strand:+ start:294 stop:473 length:180 start_codon:yes stop_codon:yes gene_type:complete